MKVPTPPTTSRSLNLGDGTTAKATNNYLLTNPTNSAHFVAASGGNFELKASASQVIDQGTNLGSDVPADIRGKPTARQRIRHRSLRRVELILSPTGSRAAVLRRREGTAFRPRATTK
jgi:hypothetical protein